MSTDREPAYSNSRMRENHRHSDNPWPDDLPDGCPEGLAFRDWIESLPPEQQCSYGAWVQRNHDRITRQMRSERWDAVLEFVALAIVVLIVVGAISFVGNFLGFGGGSGNDFWIRRR